MLNIIKADFYRLRKSKMVLGILCGLLVFLLLGNLNAKLGSAGQGDIIPVADMKELNTVSFYPNGSAIILNLLRASNIMVFCLIPIVLYVFISDFKLGTTKNLIPFKYSRAQIYIAKWLFCSLLCLLLPIFYCLVGLLMNQLFHGFSGTFQVQDFIQMFKIILLQTPLYIGFTGVLLLIGIAFQSSVAVTAVTISYPVVIMFTSGYLNLPHLSRFEPITCLDLAAHIPDLSNTDITRIIGVGSVMAIASVVLGFLLFQRKSIR